MSEENRHELPPSKTQQKQEAKELRALGAELVALPDTALYQLQLPDNVLEAVLDARTMRSHGARKRQIGFIGKQLRGIDAAPIFDALEERRNAARGLTAAHHRVEAWRDRLLEEGDAALGDLLSARPEADPQQLRQLMRNAAREAQHAKPPAAARKLFKVLREMDDREALPQP